MTAPASRRGFLRGLTTLPLIGGGVALLGSPTAVAEPCTDATLNTYVAFLAHEHREALVEQEHRKLIRRAAQGIAQGETIRPGYVEEATDKVRRAPHIFWFPHAPVVQRTVTAASPSTRAALVLSAVGCDWREGRHG